MSKAKSVNPSHAWLSSRLTTRALGVIGVLMLVFAWRVDNAVRTAYASGWQTPAGERLPSPLWVHIHAFSGALALLALLAALTTWHLRKGRQRATGAEEPTPPAALGDHRMVKLAPTRLTVRSISRFLTAGALLSIATALAFRFCADLDGGSSKLTWSLLADLLTLLLLGVLALTTGKSASSSDVPLRDRTRRFVQRHRINLIGVAALVLTVNLVPQTSGQAVDSIRAWAAWSGEGLARLAFGLSTTLLLALVVYESSVRLTHAKTCQREVRARYGILIGLGVLALGFLLGTFSVFGYGLMIVGGVIFVFGLMELPDVPVPTEATPPPPPGDSYDATAEYLAIVPLIGIAAIAIAATVDASLSRGHTLASIALLAPAGLLAGSAVVMTARTPHPGGEAELVPRRLRLPIAAGPILVGGLLLVVRNEWVAAGFGVLFFVFELVYVALLFLASSPVREGTRRLTLSLPVAIAAGVFVFFGIHLDLTNVSETLGVFSLVNLSLAFILAWLYFAVEWSLKRRPPKLLAWFQVEQLPILTVVVVCWIGASLVVPNTLHDVRVTERQILEASGALPAAPDLRGVFKKWLAAQPELGHGKEMKGTTIPLVLVAAHGGGIRAAYWTALALDCMVGVEPPPGLKPADLFPDDETTCTNKRRSQTAQQTAARRLFLLSGVSGGAVGFYAYARKLLAKGDLGNGSWVEDRLGQDFASPLIAWGLFHEIPNHIIGLRPHPGGKCTLHLFGGDQCQSNDRAAALDDAFDRVWPVNHPTPNLRSAWDLRSSPNEQWRQRGELVPLVLTNATVTGGSTRAVISAANLAAWPKLEESELSSDEPGVDTHPLAGTVEVSDVLCQTGDLRLSSAALLGARFPYVEPSGHLFDSCSESKVQANADSTCASVSPRSICNVGLVDGGYTDNSGLFTIEALLPSLRQMVINFNRNSASRIAIVIIQLDNHYQPSLIRPARAKGGGSETFIPLTTALGGRTAIETFARAAAFRLTPPDCTVTIAPSLHPGLVAPLGWELSKGAQKDLRHGLVEARPNATSEEDRVRPETQLRRLQEWLGGTANQFSPPLSECVPAS